MTTPAWLPTRAALRQASIRRCSFRLVPGVDEVAIDGADLTDTQRPLGRSGTPRLFLPPLSRDALPPDVISWLPTARPTRAMVAVCGCGVAECDSLWVRVRRVGNRVLWEPDDRSPRGKVDRSWLFDLPAYLDAIDDAVVASHRLETRAHSIARELRRRRDSLFGFGMSTREQIFTLFDAEAALDPQDRDAGLCLGVQVAGADGLHWYLLPLPADRDDDDILVELHDFHPDRYHINGRAPWVRDPPWPPKGSRRRGEQA